MAVDERWRPAPEFWPAPETLEALGANADLILLPDRVDTSPDGNVVAAFREEAQAFRVDALKAGLKVQLVRPPESAVAAYREHAAEWVLPFILSIPAGVAINLISNRIQRWIDENRGSPGAPRLRYREAHIVEGEVRVRELEGPADEVAALLRSGRAASDRGDDPPALESGQ